jgi:peptide/bleomycin uptake transporter
MLVEFFCQSRHVYQLFVAWSGLFVVLAHACVHGWLKFEINVWYGSFYDLLETAGAMSANNDTTVDAWTHRQQQVSSSIVAFMKLACVSVVFMPFAKFVRSCWTLHWRLALMHAYVSAWAPTAAPIEGASQRVHEDSYRFARGVELCLSTVLDSIITLVVFIPVLHELGSRARCPDSMSAFAWLEDAWIVGLAVSSALVGFLVTMILGHRLVRLEVDNQVVEAELRRDLVLVETTPASICVETPQEAYGSTTNLMPPLTHFLPLFERIQRNYSRLFLNFGALNLWLALFDQVNIILPYIVIGPLLFSPHEETRILLGTLVQVSNSFEKVFGSLSVVAENWTQINEFRSVLIRLRQYESNVYQNIPHPSRRGLPRAFRSRTRAVFGPPVDVEVTNADGASDNGGRVSRV